MNRRRFVSLLKVVEQDLFWIESICGNPGWLSPFSDLSALKYLCPAHGHVGEVVSTPDCLNDEVSQGLQGQVLNTYLVDFVDGHNFCAAVIGRLFFDVVHECRAAGNVAAW